MSKIITIARSDFASGNRFGNKEGKGADSGRLVFGARRRSGFIKSQSKGSAKIGFNAAGFILAAIIVSLGSFYLFQVNDLATKGYEIKEVENEIKELKKINAENKIKEVELRSMYNIERSTEELNLVSSDDVSYLEINGPVAMK